MVWLPLHFSLIGLLSRRSLRVRHTILFHGHGIITFIQVLVRHSQPLRPNEKSWGQKRQRETIVESVMRVAVWWSTRWILNSVRLGNTWNRRVKLSSLDGLNTEAASTSNTRVEWSIITAGLSSLINAGLSSPTNAGLSIAFLSSPTEKCLSAPLHRKSCSDRSRVQVRRCSRSLRSSRVQVRLITFGLNKAHMWAFNWRATDALSTFLTK